MSESPNKEPILSLPPNGRKYQKGDFEQACALTPIPLFDIPRYLVKKDILPGWRAPHVWCGWLGKQRMMEIIEKKFPNRVLKDDEGPMVIETVAQLPQILFEALDIPEEYRDFIRVVDAACKDGKLDGALVVGDNYTGIVPTNTYALYDIMHEFFDGVEPNWFLDPYNWRWQADKVIKPVKPLKKKRTEGQNTGSKPTVSSAA